MPAGRTLRKEKIYDNKQYSHIVLNLFHNKTKHPSCYIIKIGNLQVFFFNSRILQPEHKFMFLVLGQEIGDKADYTLLITLELLNHVYLHQILGFSKQRESKHSMKVMSYDLMFQHTVNLNRNFSSAFSGNVQYSPTYLRAAAWSLSKQLWYNYSSTRGLSEKYCNHFGTIEITFTTYILLALSCDIKYILLENSVYLKELFLL